MAYQRRGLSCSIAWCPRSEGCGPVAEKRQQRGSRPAMSQSRKEPMMPTLKGSCLCGAVRYELDQPEAPDGSCGCLVCREANVLAFIGNVGIARSQFRWTAGEVGLSTYDIAPGIRRRLCATCSSPLVDELLASRLVAVRVATLDRGIEEADQECILHRMRQTPSKAPKG